MKKKLLLVLASSLSIIGVSAQQKTIDTYSTYDVNQNGLVDVQDAVLVANSAIEKINDPSQVVTASDLSVILSDILQTIQDLRNEINEVNAQFDPLANREYVDLGMKDKNGNPVYWATCNLGAGSRDNAGHVFAWGETESRGTDYIAGFNTLNWDGYKWIKDGYSADWQTISKYTFDDDQTMCVWYDSNGQFIGDGKTILSLEDDAANVALGGAWRIPTAEELNWLISQPHTIWENGCFFKNEETGQTLVLPLFPSSDEPGYCAHYWSSELTSRYSDWAMNLNISYPSRTCYVNGKARCYHYFIRPVCTVPKQ